jgi:hypothetical protein
MLARMNTPLRLCQATIALGLAACAPLPPASGTTQAELLQAWGTPTARYALDAGAQRLEYASGPYGRTTWMVDLDAQQRVTRSRQVLNENEFLAVQSATALQRDGLLRWLGTPGERRHGGRAGGEVWSWRYLTNDCLWFQASVAEDGRVTGAAYGIDPRCDVASDARQ